MTGPDRPSERYVGDYLARDESEARPGWGCVIGVAIAIVLFAVLVLSGALVEIFGDDDPDPTRSTEAPLR